MGKKTAKPPVQTARATTVSKAGSPPAASTPISTAGGSVGSATASAAGITKLKIDLENCYGIKKLKAEFDFSQHRAFAIYAPNGAMKSSLAETFKNVADGQVSKDRIFPTRVCKREIKDQNGADIAPEAVVVVQPYDKEVGHTEKTSTLLVNAELRKEYEKLHLGIHEAKERLIAALKKQSQSTLDVEKEISIAFTKDGNFFNALRRVRAELEDQSDAPFADVRYDSVFDEKVVALLGSKNVKDAIKEYITKYNELLEASTYFKKGIFNYHNANTIAKNLASNGFFDAKHAVHLNGTAPIEITSQAELEHVIEMEKQSILKDKSLRKRFDEVEKAVGKNTTLREFQDYLAANELILPELANIDVLREKLWKSYLKVHHALYVALLDQYEAVEKRRRAIEEQAQKESTQWERVIDIFNHRFIVPFTLVAENKWNVVLNNDPILKLGFKYRDGNDEAAIGKDDLLAVLSTGEKKAFYIINVIFEVEVRKRLRQDTLFVIDDVADSFDYKNKYAIIQYLKDISEEPFFKQIILTHNFDFLRTIESRFIPYSHCRMASKSNAGLALDKAVGIRNVFVKDWKGHFFDDAKKRIASIPFIRNLIEYTRGETDVEYLKLTSLLHWRTGSAAVTQGDLDAVYNGFFGTREKWPNQGSAVVDMILHEASQCIAATAGANFEHKIVLSIAIRLLAEKFMVTKIADPTFVSQIDANQTTKLLKKYAQMAGADASAIAIIEQVILMTPENIHLNSFMYEPILDMSDDHLRKLYQDVLTLK